MVPSTSFDLKPKTLLVNLSLTAPIALVINTPATPFPSAPVFKALLFVLILRTLIFTFSLTFTFIRLVFSYATFLTFLLSISAIRNSIAFS